MEQFGGAPPSDAPAGALTSAFAPTEKNSMPALSADSTLGPGALNAGPGDDHVYDGLMGIASSLAGISNPDQAKALIAQQTAMKKVAGDTGTWSHIMTPDGRLLLTNSKDPRKTIQLPGNFAKPQEDEYEKAAKVAGAKSNQDYGDSIAKPPPTPTAWPATSLTLRRVFSNPGVYQGTGGEWVQSARKLYAGVTGDTEGAKNIADGDIAKRAQQQARAQAGAGHRQRQAAPRLVLGQRPQVRHADVDVAGEQAGANQRCSTCTSAPSQRAQQAEQARAAHLEANGGIYRPSIRRVRSARCRRSGPTKTRLATRSRGESCRRPCRSERQRCA
jgi:hypothetical protein